jgi:hypothetical protein
MKYLFDGDLTTTMVIENNDQRLVSFSVKLNDGTVLTKNKNGCFELTYNMTEEELNQLSGIIYHIKKQLNER